LNVKSLINTNRHFIAKVGAGLGLGLHFSRLPGIIKLSEVLRSSVTARILTTSLMKRNIKIKAQAKFS